MSIFSLTKRPVMLALVLAVAGQTLPALAQNAAADTANEPRIRKLEAEVRALQRQVFPGGDGKYFPPQVQPGQAAAPPTGTPATTPVTDLLNRMDSIEAQLARLTSQTELNTNKLAQLEARLNALAPPPEPSPAPAAVTTEPAPSVSLSTPAASTAPAPAPVAVKPAVAVATPKPAVVVPAPKPAAVKPAAPSAKRLAAVQSVAKPATNDPGDDEYSYGYRLWEAKFYPEAQQQLKMMLQKYPKHARVSYARNLLGRTYLDDNNPREAASWFLQNYQASKTGERAPDSLLYLGEAMRQLKDTNRACVALSQFAGDYPREMAGRLKAQYEALRGAVKCN